jgi:hypothetical protein
MNQIYSPDKMTTQQDFSPIISPINHEFGFPLKSEALVD